MKAKLIVKWMGFMLLAASVMSIGSCTQVYEQQNGMVQDSEEIVEDEALVLLSTLQNFNETVLQAAVTTREGEDGFWHTVWKVTKRVVKVASGDLLGAAEGGAAGAGVGYLIGGAAGAGVGLVAGGITCGVSGSIEAYEKDVEQNQDKSECAPMEFNWETIYSNPKYVYDTMVDITEDEIQQEIARANVDVSFFEEHPEYVRIGAMHNICLQKLSEPVGDKVTPAIIGGSIESRIMQHPDYIRQYQAALDNISYYLGEFDKVFGEYGINPTYNPMYASSTAKEILKLFSDLYTKYPSKIEDVDFIIDYYAEHIFASSALSETDKDALFSSLSVAAYSPRYWVDHLLPIE